jgi:uncharacterized membrane protein
MKTLRLTRWHIILSVLAWGIVFGALSIYGINPFELLTIVGFLFLAIVPGLLTVFALRLKGLSVWGYAGLIVGFSVLELIIVALLGNTFLPFEGIARPLDKPVLLWEVCLLIAALSLVVWLRIKEIEISFRRFMLFDSVRDFALATVPAIFVLLAVMGAIRLNNGGSDIFTLSMLIALAIYCAVLIRYSDRVGPNVIPTAFFFMSTALLLMNSLRGWLITGHDIQREYFVFELAKNAGFWNIAAYRDSYNACMSITILPTIFGNLLGIPDPYVYKVLFQILFATVPSIIYLTIRRYVSSAIAFLSAFYFIAFPTFYSDMSFLNRQEIAFLFLALMLYVIFSKALSPSMKRALFLIFGIGMVLSHYSTTYTVVAILIFLSVVRPIVTWVTPCLKKMKAFSRSGIETLSPNAAMAKPLIAFWMVVVLAMASFLWSSVLTNTASNSLSTVVAATFSAMRNASAQDARSSDVSASLLSWGTPSPSQLLAEYEQADVLPVRALAATGTYYSAPLYGSYQIQAVSQDVLPLTPLGRALASIGIDLTALNYDFRQASAKLLQILIIIGFFYVLFRGKFMKRPRDMDFVLLSLGSLIMLAAIVVLPVLSVEYGLLRAFQQSLMFLGVFIVIGTLALAVKLGKKWQIFFASALAIVFLLSEVGVFTQLFGGYNPQLDLNNAGVYYDIYYSHESEAAGIAWLTAAVQGDPDNVQTEVQNGFYTVHGTNSVTDLNPQNDIYPGLVRQNSYVFLGYTTVRKQQATISYNGTQITYTYPIQFLDDNKNLVYNNGDVNIYK